MGDLVLATTKEKFSSIDINCTYDMDLSSLEIDLQGWSSDHHIFEKVIRKYDPKLILEIGTWKGASAIHMAELAPDAEVICVDTWLGSNDTLWLKPESRPLLNISNGYPNIYPQFIKNITAKGLDNRIYPMPMTSACAFNVLDALDIRPDVIYIDADHTYDGAYKDIVCAHKLNKNAIIFGDDYLPDWPGVVKAVNDFSDKMNLEFIVDEPKWIFEI